MQILCHFFHILVYFLPSNPQSPIPNLLSPIPNHSPHAQARSFKFIHRTLYTLHAVRHLNSRQAIHCAYALNAVRHLHAAGYTLRSRLYTRSKAYASASSASSHAASPSGVAHGSPVSPHPSSSQSSSPFFAR